MIELPRSQSFTWQDRVQVNPEEAIRLLGMEQPKPPRSKCPFSEFLLVLTPDHFVWFSPPCKSWRCLLCLPSLRWKWGTHAMDLLPKQGCGFHQSLVQASEWQAARRSINKPRRGKGKGSFIRVRDLVISTAPIGFDGSPTVGTDSAIRAIGEVLRGIDPQGMGGKRIRPASTSRDWSLPKLEKSGCTVVASVGGNTPPEKIAEAMKSSGIPLCQPNPGVPWTVRFPSWVDASAIDAAVKLLA